MAIYIKLTREIFINWQHTRGTADGASNQNMRIY